MRKPGDPRAGLVALAHALAQFGKPIHHHLDGADTIEFGHRRTHDIPTRDEDEAIPVWMDVILPREKAAEGAGR